MKLGELCFWGDGFVCDGGALGRVLGVDLGLRWCFRGYCGGKGGGGEVG